MRYPINNWEKLKRGYLFKEKTFYSLHHLGLDVIAPIGTPIYAWQNLKVIKAMYGPEGGYTIHITCPNNPRLFRCLHMNKAGKVGDYKEGDIIGYVGKTGSLSRGPHLHIDITKNGILNIGNINNFEDPEAYFKAINKLNIDSMIVKRKGSQYPALYVLAGSKLLPIATDWPTYLIEFGDPNKGGTKIYELSDTEFKKYKIATIFQVARK